MTETVGQRICREMTPSVEPTSAMAWGCPCHRLPGPPWPSGGRPAVTCPVCEHPDLAGYDMDAWWEAKQGTVGWIGPLTARHGDPA